MIVRLHKTFSLSQLCLTITKLLKENKCLSSRKIQTISLKNLKPGGLLKVIDKYKIKIIKKLMYLLYNLIY